MKKIYNIAQDASRWGFLSANTIYMILRTLAVFLSSLLIGFLLKDYIHMPATTPEIFVVIFSGWITVIFGFWGGLLYLMRKD